MAELRTQLPKPYAARRGTESPALFLTEAAPIRYTCRLCGGIGHFVEYCPSLTFEANHGRIQSRSYTAQGLKMYAITKSIRVLRWGTKIPNQRLNDTKSAITISGLDCATMYEWTMYKHPMQSVKSPNNEEMLIEGATYVTLRVSSRNIKSETLIHPI